MATIKKSDLVQFGSLELLAKQVVEGFITGLHKSPFHGFSVEFAEHRLYNSGESTKHIDWKLYGRTEKLFTKKYDEETNLRCQIVIDCSNSMFFGNKSNTRKIDHAIFAAASLIELLKKQRDAIGLSLINEKVDIHTPSKTSISHLHFLYQTLEELLSTNATKQATSANLPTCLHEIAEMSHKRSLILVFSDFIGGIEEQSQLIQSLQHLKHNQHEVILFHVIDKQLEIDFKLDKRPLKIVDMETMETIQLNPSGIQKSYEELVNNYYSDLALKAGHQKIDFVTTDINESLDKILLKYLIKRNTMR
jgi:uncharacterized protein (DUF58 family)